MRLSTLLLAAALTGVGGVAMAEPGGHRHGSELLAGVTLTDAQRAQVHTIEQAGWAQAKTLFQQMRALHEQITAQMLSSGSVSQDALSALMTKEEAVRGQLDQQRLSVALQIRQVLTPDQLAQAAATHQQLEVLRDREHQLMHPTTAD